jgi:enoyl-CoA hydratase
MRSLAVVSEVRGKSGLIRLNRPERLNAWDRPMRDEIVRALKQFDADTKLTAIIMTGTGERAFSAGQDLAEAHDFDGKRAEEWIREFEIFYGVIRALTKPIIMALNGTTAGSAFQVALLADIRIAHPEVTMGQPEINSGIASITGPWIMREMLGLSRTTELSLTGRLMNADECYRIGIVHHVVPRDQVLNKAFEIADELGQKAPLAMRLNKAWLRKMTEAGFREAFDAAMLAHRISYDSGEPARMIDLFFAHRSDKSER